jgi:hypothetical protein
MDAFTARAQMHRVRELLGHSFGFAEA